MAHFPGETVNTTELNEGDYIRSHGAVLRLSDRKVHEDHPRGPVITFRGEWMNEDDPEVDSLMARWMREDGYWSVQGNELATWWRIARRHGRVLTWVA